MLLLENARINKRDGSFSLGKSQHGINGYILAEVVSVVIVIAIEFVDTGIEFYHIKYRQRFLTKSP